LDDTTFDSHIAQNELTLVEFYAPWCGHCKSLVPEYDAASMLLDGIASLAKVDCTLYRDLCGKFEVQGFPTLKLFRNDGSDPTDYDQARKSDAIQKFVLRQKSAAYTVVTDKESLDKVTNSGDFVVVGFVGADDKANTEQFVTLAKAYRTDFEFALVHDAALTKAHTQIVPNVIIFRKFDDPQVPFNNPIFTAEALEEFLVENALPLLGNIGPENYQKYVERGFPLVWMFVDPAAKDQTVLDIAREVAKDFKKSMSFVQLDGVRWADHAKTFGLNGAIPGIVIEDRVNKKNYVFPPQELTVAALKHHVQSFVDGTLQPTVKSEPIPETNDGPVKIVVGKSFESIVMDPTKDVLLEIYAPWCGHCKTLAPKYEKLGESFVDQPSIVIAKMDGTENDIPLEIRGFPTLVFYPANDKQNPTNYDGDRTEAALAKFIRENAFTLKGGAAEPAVEPVAEDNLKDEL